MRARSGLREGRDEFLQPDQRAPVAVYGVGLSLILRFVIALFVWLRGNSTIIEEPGG